MPLNHWTRRRFLSMGVVPMVVGAGIVTQCNKVRRSEPKVTFYGAAQCVSGSCHLLETSAGLFLIDCGVFSNEGADPPRKNDEFPFDPREVKAVFLTHAHTDHNGRIPLLVARGFRGPIFCSELTRKLSKVMLEMVTGVAESNPDQKPLYDPPTVAKTLEQMRVMPYETIIEELGVEFRFSEAGHILGSAMIEIWADNRKLLFTGDMGNDAMPLLPKPKQHEEADLVLVESTYGDQPRDVVRFEDFGKKIMQVISRGGSVLLPAFVLHKTQALIYIINKLKSEGVIDPHVPVFSDSTTAKKITAIYDESPQYWGPDAQRMKTLFYRNNYRELSGSSALNMHGKGPAIYISSSGNMDHANAPKHLLALAANPKNAVIVVGWQSPHSLGAKLLAGEKAVMIPWETYEAKNTIRTLRSATIELQVTKWNSGFSSHARGEQIAEWLSRFRRVGTVCVVHGEAAKAKALAATINAMGLHSLAPVENETHQVTSDRQTPGGVPTFSTTQTEPKAITDQ